jgi:hypothetical protein
MSDKLKKKHTHTKILDYCHSQQGKSLMTLSGQKESSIHMRISLIALVLTVAVWFYILHATAGLATLICVIDLFVFLTFLCGEAEKGSGSGAAAIFSGNSYRARLH